MSNIPSRTRSLRKPAGDVGARGERSALTDSSASNTIATERSSHSPSRLPVKPFTRTTRAPSVNSSITGSTPSLRPPPTRNSLARPTKELVQSSSSARSSNVSSHTEPPKTDRSRPPVTQSRHLRNASTNPEPSAPRGSGHTRTKSSSTVLGPPPALRPPTRESNEPQPSRPASVKSHTSKPAFSALQQHFSPAKNLAPKPHPAAFLAPPSPSKLPSNIAISAETAKLQNELLQLHLLHRDIDKTEAEWRSSAKKKLGDRFKSLVESSENLVALEAEQRGKTNAAALQQWRDTGTPDWGLEERIQVLDEVLIGVWNLGEAGGKYARLIGKFERWFHRYQDILEVRSRDDELDDEHAVFVEELESGWKDDCSVIRRKLESWRELLRHLGTPDPGSSLAQVVNNCRNLVQGMLAELATIGQIERDAMIKEVEWIRSMNDDDTDLDDTTVAGAVWRRL